MIKIKNEGERARVGGTKTEAGIAIDVAYSVFRDHSVPDMVVTSLGEIFDGRRKGSRHLWGFAFDLRTRGLAQSQAIRIADQLREALGSDYDVVLESNHIHVEFDPEP